MSRRSLDGKGTSEYFWVEKESSSLVWWRGATYDTDFTFLNVHLNARHKFNCTYFASF